MEYFITFIEGILTFISPCLLPMLPVYFTYLAGNIDKEKKGALFINALGFVFGFTIIFVAMGALAQTFGKFIFTNLKTVNLVGGILIILFGINISGILRLPFLNNTFKLNIKVGSGSFLTSMLLGIIFSIGWTPCVGAFLGAALMQAASSQTKMHGILLLLSYSIGLGVPFLLSSVLLEQLKGVFTSIKKHYAVINVASGLLLVVMGVLIATGKMASVIGFFS